MIDMTKMIIASRDLANARKNSDRARILQVTGIRNGRWVYRNLVKE